VAWWEGGGVVDAVCRVGGRGGRGCVGGYWNGGFFWPGGIIKEGKRTRRLYFYHLD